ncbi:hypothetical protein M9H77_31677 [Catharanthus roseus]|uniref:Uncharacterized protein n=1 Tax=Catharanthus roseus TaxID=4058 RepID=A0ACC0A0Q6_CATRO|nr:hypothetical protein M9H77_31677 [Catharanthus roseus]
MRVSSTDVKSERIKTHQCSFYTRMQRNIQCRSRAQRTRSGSQNEVIRIKFQRLVCSGINLSFKPLLALHKAAIPPQSMMQCPRRPIRRHPPRSMPLFKWIRSPESESSMPSKEAFVRGTSHIRCNPLTLPNIRS